MFFVNHRWLGGTLTNWATLQKSIKRLKTLKAMVEDGRMAAMPKKEASRLDREMRHLQQNFEGVENMAVMPDAMFVIDPGAETIAVREARRMGVPVVAIVDTNCDPDLVDAVIPGNDDALRAIRLFTNKISDAVVEGRQLATEQDFVAEKIISDETPAEEIPEYAQYVDPKYNEQLMSESILDEDLPSTSLPKKGAASEAAVEEVSTRNS
jgi:small subunit ribosomal protein S2